MISVIFALEIMLFVLASYAMITPSTAICIVISNVVSAVMVILYCFLQAPDIAITEAVIGTATSTILFALTLLYLKQIKTNSNQMLSYRLDIRQQLIVFILCSALFFILVNIIQNLPRSSVYSISTQSVERISNFYIKNSLKDFGFASIVTAVVAGYRAFDTMFENVVIFIGCYGFYSILKMEKDDKTNKEFE